jgi:capsule polysaccharide export protein KpsE/RkpR
MLGLPAPPLAADVPEGPVVFAAPPAAAPAEKSTMSVRGLKATARAAISRAKRFEDKTAANALLKRVETYEKTKTGDIDALRADIKALRKRIQESDAETSARAVANDPSKIAADAARARLAGEDSGTAVRAAGKGARAKAARQDARDARRGIPVV